MTTSDPRAPSTLVEIINSGWATAGAVVAGPLAGVAVATGAWGWAVGAIGAVGAGCAMAVHQVRSRRSRPHGDDETMWTPEPPGQGIRTYNFLSETRISILHAQMNSGKESDRLIEEMRKAQGHLKGGINVPRVSIIGERMRERASRYQRRLEHTLPTMADYVLSHLERMELIHRTDDVDLDDVAALVAQPDSDDQFLKFYMAGPEFRQAVPWQWLPPWVQLANDHQVVVESHGFKITLHIGRRGMQEDFAALEDKENAAVVGVLRRLDTDTRTATVRVIAVY